jgi:RimJ/RimL family protein N-acetyltransferase
VVDRAELAALSFEDDRTDVDALPWPLIRPWALVSLAILLGRRGQTGREQTETMTPTTIETERLVLRHWRTEDSEPFAALNADTEVMEYFASTLGRTESDGFIDRIVASFARNGFGLWALEVRATGEFIGFTGLSIPSFEAAFMPNIEVGWRLSRGAWGNGFATEAARASLRVAFDEHGLSEVVSFTSEHNTRSRAVMERLAMTHDPDDDFDHPALAGHRLARHVLYRMPVDRWRARGF